ncbi:MAG: diacylglycerol/polyprenol kinase family protein [Promethearchaeota archaeon]|jgi:phytol kinase
MAYSLEFFLYDLGIVGIAFLYIIITIVLPMILYKKDKISKFTARKSVHLLAGLVVITAPFYIWPFWPTIIAGIFMVLVYFSSKDSKVKQLKELYETISEEQEEDLKRAFLQGPFFYATSLTLLVLVFGIFAPDQFYFAIAGSLIMIIADTLASVVGKRWGKISLSLKWTKSKRTLEGSLTFFGTAFLLCFLSFFLFGSLIPTWQAPLSFSTILIYSLITSLIATVIELISPSTFDDLTVPLGSTVIIYLLTLL